MNGDGFHLERESKRRGIDEPSFEHVEFELSEEHARVCVPRQSYI